MGFGYGFGQGFAFTSIGGMSKGATSTLTSSASSVDGLYHVTVTMSAVTAGISTSNFTVTNGSAEYITTRDNITYDLSVVPNGAGDVTVQLNGGAGWSASNALTTTINPSWQHITETGTAHFYYDFRELVGLNGTVVTAGEVGMLDLSKNSYDLVKVGNPSMVELTAGLRTFEDVDAKSLSIGNTGNSIFNDDFSLFFKVKLTDGQPASTLHFCGNREAVNIGVVVSIQTTGKLRINYMTAVWESTAAVFANGATAWTTFDIHFDFTNDVLSVYQDGVAVAGSFTSGSMAALDPSTFSMSQNFYIASFNNNGTAGSCADTAYMDYFTCCTYDSSLVSSIRSYLTNKKPTLEFLASVTDANYLKYPHDVIISSDGTKAYVSGKGDATLTTVDGSFGIVDISTPASPSVTGGYFGVGNQKDGETVLELSSTRVLHFVDDAALLINVSTSSGSLVKSVTNANGVVNGAVQIGDYVFGANKGGYIDVFDVSDIDNFTLVGSYDANGIDGILGPHDIDVCDDGEHIVICGKTVGPQFAIYKVMNAGALIPIASWTAASTVTSSSNPNLTGANRIRVMSSSGGVEQAILHQLKGGTSTGDNVVVYNITNKSAPVYQGTYSLALGTQRGSTGAGIYRDKYQLVGNDQGIRIIDTTTMPSAPVQQAGYFNTTEYSAGANNNIHDLEAFTISGQNYLILTAHNEGISVFKINRI